MERAILYLYEEFAQKQNIVEHVICLPTVGY